MSDQEDLLLYDPLFENPPDTVIRDTPGRGFWGKAAVKKTVFVVFLTLFVGASIALSFSSLKKPRFRFEEAEGGFMLSEYHADKTDAVLPADAVYTEDGEKADGTLTAIREYALCCDENTAFIFIGRDVKDVPGTAFYACSALEAVLVDEENPYFKSVDGVLYRQENGELTELMLYPARHDLYAALLTLGEAPPATVDEAAALAEKGKALDEKSKKWREKQQSGYPDLEAYAALAAEAAKEAKDGDADPFTEAEAAALLEGYRYEILPEIARIGDMAFSECKTLYEVTIPEGVADIGSMAFYKCENLRSLDLPESTKNIGSDGFSYCKKIDYLFIPAGVESLGHHAFFGCEGVDAVYFGASENHAPALGQNWRPQVKKLFMRDVPVNWGAERRTD